MIELLVVAALHWPAECVSFGEFYRDAAIIRDHGRPLAEVFKMVKDKRQRLAISHTYERPDMTARDWYWMAVGICIGQKDPGNVPVVAVEGAPDGPSSAVQDSGGGVPRRHPQRHRALHGDA